MRHSQSLFSNQRASVTLARGHVQVRDFNSKSVVTERANQSNQEVGGKRGQYRQNVGRLLEAETKRAIREIANVTNEKEV